VSAGAASSRAGGTPVGGSRAPGGDELLAASGIGKRFGRKLVLEEAALSARSGEAVAIVGENGAGKSTLLRICAGVDRPDRGTVTAQGQIGYCPQEPGLFDLLNADEHLALFAPALGLSRADGVRDGWRLLGELGFPVGDPTPTRRLSGGARQKLNLALTLLGDARVLLLDEPYQGFDHGGYVSFWEHVARWRAEGLAIVIVTHLLADVTLVDRVVELSIPRQGSGEG
jgi:ABC-type multidrug transport system ATPase subunit